MNTRIDQDGWSPQGPVTELTEEHCWDFLSRNSIGRLAVSADDKPSIFPVDFWSDGRSILFRTSEGTKLADLLANDNVAFEADEHTSRRRVSVVIEGHAHVVKDADEIREADQASLPTWVPVAVPVYVRIVPSRIRGREFSREIVRAHAE